jgi:hypothetical protein
MNYLCLIFVMTVFKLCNVEWCDEWCIGTDLGWSTCHGIEIISLHFAGGTEENWKTSGLSYGHFSLQYEVCGRDSSFFVDNLEAAENLAIADRKITTIQGFKVHCS